MVDRMRCPKPVYAVAAAMEPVVAEVLCKYEHDHSEDAAQRYSEQPMLPGEIDQGLRQAEWQERVNEVLAAERIDERCQVGAPIVVTPHHEGQDEALQRRDNDHGGKGELQHLDQSCHGNLRIAGRAFRAKVARGKRGGAPIPEAGLTDSCKWPIKF